MPQTAASLGYHVQNIARQLVKDKDWYRHYPVPGREQTDVQAEHQRQQKVRQRPEYARTRLLEKAPANGTACPACRHLLDRDLRWKRQRQDRSAICPNCGIHLMAPKSRPRRYPLLEYVSRRHRHWHDLLIIDEAHQYKAETSARGEVVGRCAQRSKKILALTGTYMGGYASHVFHLLQRTKPEFQREFRWEDLNRFIREFGCHKHHYVLPRQNRNRANSGHSWRKAGGARMRKERVEEIPGYHPMMLRYLLDSSVFTTLADLKRYLPADDPRRALPPPQVIPVLLPLDDRVHGQDAMSQAEWQTRLETAMRAYAAELLGAGHRKGLALMKEELLAGPENCWQGTQPKRQDNGKIIIDLPPLDPGAVYPKEQAMLEILQDQKARGRKTLIYCCHTDLRNTAERTRDLLQAHGINAVWMRTAGAGRVPPEKRLEWLENQAGSVDAIIVNPNSVATGLNLTGYPTIVWQEIAYSMTTAEQASARSDRINQTLPIEVYYLAYAGTLQERALESLAAKFRCGPQPVRRPGQERPVLRQPGRRTVRRHHRQRTLHRPGRRPRHRPDQHRSHRPGTYARRRTVRQPGRRIRPAVQGRRSRRTGRPPAGQPGTGRPLEPVRPGSPVRRPGRNHRTPTNPRPC